ncbi:MAG: DUF167 domain-containing protein [Actinomycetia bacterium]|nr:DUF167 domain-containing protein [Actinomycetes bacterium]
MPHLPIRSTATSVLIDVLVVPNASRTAVVGIHGDRVKVRVTAPPERGRANVAVARLLADETGGNRAEVVSGHSSRTKTVEVWGVGVQAAARKLIDEP